MGEYFYGITDKGKRREKNEDTFFVRETAGKQLVVACVIDGVGGYKGGDVAAGIARSAIMKHLDKLSDNITETLQQAVIAANASINQAKKSGAENDRMACVLTCAAIDLKNNKCWYAHVGDTRIYLLRDQSLIKISRDHSAIGFLEESGRLSEEEAMRHPRRNEINKALGFEEYIDSTDDFIETGESPFLPGDTILLCSDGLTDMISSGKIVDVLTTQKSLAVKAKELIDAANDAGGNDNITAVLIEHRKVAEPAMKPVLVKSKKDAGTSASNLNEGKTESAVLYRKRNGRNPIALLGLVLAGLLAVTVILTFKKNEPPKAKYLMPAPSPDKTNEQFQQLIASVNDSTRTFVLPEKGISSNLTQPIIISKDSFYLKGNGSIFTADSLYKGAAFIINSTARHIVLDSLVLKNFDVGIILQKNNITLKHIRFINCRAPVEYMLSFPDSVVSGKFQDSIFINH